MYKRLCNLLQQKSFLLLGPRGVGKTWLLRELFSKERELTTINLLKDEEYLALVADPGSLRRFVNTKTPSGGQWILIDEVQRVPALLSEVHDILEDPKYHNKVRFALTGSSARKLKRGGADLLAGRALVNYLYPLSIFETGSDWTLEQSLNWGNLPAIVTAESDEIRAETLRSYVGTYLKEEIKEEQIVRKLEPFVRFLEAAAQANGTLIKYANIANAALAGAKAVERYFEILEDTLVGFFLEPYTRSARERALGLSKFYLFDTGVKRALERTLTSTLRTGGSEWGRAFEHYIILECVRLNSYFKKDAKFSQLATKDRAEIDLIIEMPKKSPLCIEIKSSRVIPETEVSKLIRITEAVPRGIPIVVYDGQSEQNILGVRIVPWRRFLAEVFDINPPAFFSETCV